MKFPFKKGLDPRKPLTLQDRKEGIGKSFDSIIVRSLILFALINGIWSTYHLFLHRMLDAIYFLITAIFFYCLAGWQIHLDRLDLHHKRDIALYERDKIIDEEIRELLCKIRLNNLKND